MSRRATPDRRALSQSGDDNHAAMAAATDTRPWAKVRHAVSVLRRRSKVLWSSRKVPKSLRREAERFLDLSPRRRVTGRAEVLLPRLRAKRAAGDIAWVTFAIGLLFLPIPLDFGVFGHPIRSHNYLQTAWQVVASSLGLSVAIIAVLFAALLAGTTRTLGVSLVDFATESGIMVVIRLGVTTLLVTGAALLPLGHGAPGGWAAFWSLSLCALTLGSVLWVFERAVVSLDSRRLAAMRAIKVRRAVQAALSAQLVTQAGEIYLHQHGSWLRAERALTSGTGEVVVHSPRAGQLRDLRLRRLWRHVAETEDRNGASSVRLLGLEVLNRVVAPDTELLTVPGPISPGFTCKAQKAFRIRRWTEHPGSTLREELDGLHRLALAAIRDSDQAVWDLIADAYEEAILEMPRAAAGYGLSFAGAIASPSPWGLGPLDDIQRYIFDEVESAVRSGDRSLALHVAYLPMRIATAAIDLNAPALINAMLGLYPALYQLADGAST